MSEELLKEYSNKGFEGQLAGKKLFFRRKKSCPLDGIDIKEINYKNIKLISRFISERGRILPSRITSISAKKQRALARAIKQARNAALLPFVGQ